MIDYKIAKIKTFIIYENNVIITECLTYEKALAYIAKRIIVKICNLGKFDYNVYNINTHINVLVKNFNPFEILGLQEPLIPEAMDDSPIDNKQTTKDLIVDEIILAQNYEIKRLLTIIEELVQTNMELVKIVGKITYEHNKV